MYFISAESWMTAVAFTAGVPSPPKAMFRLTVLPPRDPYLSSYDVTADGSRFLVKVAVQDVTSAPLYVLTNWPGVARSRP